MSSLSCLCLRLGHEYTINTNSRHFLAIIWAGVRLADGRVFRGKVVVSNATRWDTFEGLVGEQKMPESEKLFR